jgi:hypothetical protein
MQPDELPANDVLGNSEGIRGAKAMYGHPLYIFGLATTGAYLS